MTIACAEIRAAYVAAARRFYGEFTRAE